MTTRNFDSSTFAAWFAAYVAKNEQAMTVAERRFRPEFRSRSRLAAHRSRAQSERASRTDVHARVQGARPGQGTALSAEADHLYAEGATDGTQADQYVRVTVYLATVLFLVAISGHFPIRGVRIGLVVVGIVVLGRRARDPHHAAPTARVNVKRFGLGPAPDLPIGRGPTPSVIGHHVCMVDGFRWTVCGVALGVIGLVASGCSAGFGDDVFVVHFEK